MFLALVFAGYVVFSNITTIFPIMGSDDYFVDSQGWIHGRRCDIESPPWFTEKPCKYDIMIKNTEHICPCLLFEEKKLWALHRINIVDYFRYLRSSGVGEDIIRQEQREYVRR